MIRRFLLALALGGPCTAALGQGPDDLPEARDLARFEEALEVVAVRFVTPVDEGRLVADAIRAMERSAGIAGDEVTPPDPTGAVESPRHAALRRFAAAFARIRSAGRPRAEDDALVDAAIGGMISGLDGDSAYLVPADFAALKAPAGDEHGAIGLEVRMGDDRLEIVTVIEESPAAEAGLRAGDAIVRLDGEGLAGMTLRQAVRRMRGAPGSPLDVEVVRAGETRPRTVRIVRAVIRSQPVRSRLHSPGLGVVRIARFESQSYEALRRALDALARENGGRLDGLVLDLRGNPGGMLSAAVAVSDAFLDAGLIVYTEGRDDDAKVEFRAAPGDALAGVPVVVLVDGQSAGGAEIVAAALRDHARAAVVGETTLGHGSIQTVIPLDTGGALKITSAHFYTPAGKSIRAGGVAPQVCLRAVPANDADAALDAAAALLRDGARYAASLARAPDAGCVAASGVTR